MVLPKTSVTWRAQAKVLRDREAFYRRFQYTASADAFARRVAALEEKALQAEALELEAAVRALVEARL
jgi:hypothetical protein